MAGKEMTFDEDEIDNFLSEGVTQHEYDEIADIDFPAAIALARRRNLSAYDAAYAWLAVSRDLDLVTLDRKLYAAFEAERAAQS